MLVCSLSVKSSKGLGCSELLFPHIPTLFMRSLIQTVEDKMAAFNFKVIIL